MSLVLSLALLAATPKLAPNLPPAAKAFIEQLGGPEALPAVAPQRWFWSTKVPNGPTGREVDEVGAHRLKVVRTGPYAEEVRVIGRHAKREVSGKTEVLSGASLRLARTRAALASWSWALPGEAKIEDLGRDGKGRPMVKVTPVGGAAATLFFSPENALEDAQIRTEGLSIDLHFQDYGRVNGRFVAKVRVFLAQPQEGGPGPQAAGPLVETLEKVEPLSPRQK